MSRRRGPPEAWTAVGFALLVGLGWWLGSVPFALVGTIGVFVSGLLYFWQRECLSGVTYRRSLAHDRASFGEAVSLDVEIVNDKLLPLTWLHIEDEFPAFLGLRGGTVVSGPANPRSVLVQVTPMLPFERIRTHMSVLCDRRGLHTIGPARIRSGNPFGYRQHQLTLRDQSQLLIYPKIYRLEPPRIVPGILLGEQRVDGLVGDPSRVSGVRDYRQGDALRTVDWRATARAGSLLVREFEATASPRVTVIADLWVPELRQNFNPPELEFLIAVVASVVVDLAERGVSVGLSSGASVGGKQIAYPPTSAPGALPDMLELLAMASPYGRVRFADVVVDEGTRTSRRDERADGGRNIRRVGSRSDE